MKNNKFDTKYIPARYIQRFFSWSCAADLLEMKMFPNIKEIAESMSMFYTVESLLFNWDERLRNLRSKNKVNVIVVGDGHTPRTAATFAFSTKWNTISIDPLLKRTDWPIQRLNCHKAMLEDIPEMDFGDEHLIIIYPHSHAPVQLGWDKFKSTKKWLIKMECCTKDKLDLPYYSFKDKYAITKANNIFIWSNYTDLKFTNNESQVLRQ